MEYVSPIQKIISKMSLRGKLIENLLEFLFSNNYFIFGGTVRDYIIPDKKRSPSDFDIGVNDIEEAIIEIEKKLSFSFFIERDIIKCNNIIAHCKLILKYKFRENMYFVIDISKKEVIGSNIDFDVNGIFMTEKSTYKIIDKMKNYSLSQIINNIQNKQFKIMKSFNVPEKSRWGMGIKESSKQLLEFIKFMERTSKMLNRGWKLDGQLIEDIFQPCLIKKISNLDDRCRICTNKFNKYELELNCCKQILCFSCCYEYIKARFGNSEIPCPFCRGDPFGWKTLNDVQNENLIDLPTFDELGITGGIITTYEGIWSNHEEHSALRNNISLVYSDNDINY